MDLEVWACPVCHSQISESGEGLACIAEGRLFRRLEGLPVLIGPDQESSLREAEYYASAWRKNKWAPPPDSIQLLPYVKKRGWELKARSLQKLLEILGPPCGRRVADVGAGTGWLSYRLAQAGFRSYATDVSADTHVGLGAARTLDATSHRFERAFATLDHWPFQTNSIHVAVCNASLHYLSDVRPTLAEASRVLQPDGVFVLMNEPVHADRTSADRAGREFRKHLKKLGGRGSLVEGYRHFIASELEADLQRFFPVVRRHDPASSFFASGRALKGLLLGTELASFPIYEARA